MSGIKCIEDLHHRKIEAIRELAKLATRRHYWCDDSYYSCPATEEGCSNPAYEDTKECQCGADEHNGKIQKLLQILNVCNESTGSVKKNMANRFVQPEELLQMGEPGIVVDCPDCGGGDERCLYCDGTGTVIE